MGDEGDTVACKSRFHISKQRLKSSEKTYKTLVFRTLLVQTREQREGGVALRRGRGETMEGEEKYSATTGFFSDH